MPQVTRVWARHPAIGGEFRPAAMEEIGPRRCRMSWDDGSIVSGYVDDFQIRSIPPMKTYTVSTLSMTSNMRIAFIAVLLENGNEFTVFPVEKKMHVKIVGNGIQTQNFERNCLQFGARIVP